MKKKIIAYYLGMGFTVEQMAFLEKQLDLLIIEVEIAEQERVQKYVLGKMDTFLKNGI